MKTKKKRLIPKQIKQSAREAGAREMQKNTRISFYLVPIMCSSWFCFPLNLTRHLCVFFFSTFFRLQAFFRSISFSHAFFPSNLSFCLSNGIHAICVSVLLFVFPSQQMHSFANIIALYSVVLLLVCYFDCTLC